ncbi:hypothetical protein EMCRGX_G008478 [Ephydatia muelleri]
MNVLSGEAIRLLLRSSCRKGADYVWEIGPRPLGFHDASTRLASTKGKIHGNQSFSEYTVPPCRPPWRDNGSSAKRLRSGDADDDKGMSAPNLPHRSASFHETISSAAGPSEAKSVNRSLYEIADIYFGKFPVDVRVSAGLRRKTPLTELLTVEQALCPEVVTCSYNRQCFSIPLSVDLKFSVLWDEGEKDDVEILAGKEFTVDSLLQCHGNGPKVVSAKQDWEKDGVRVEAGEVLVVKKAASKTDTPSALKVFSLITRAEKTLPLDCSALFTNRAQCISLHLPDIVAYVPDLFPCRACILKHDFGPKCYPVYIVTLERLSRAPVLRLTSTLQATNSTGAAQPIAFNVPVDLPGVEVAVVKVGAIFSRDNILPAHNGDDVTRGASPQNLDSREPDPPTVLPRCESPVYEKLPSREPITQSSTGLAVPVCNAAMAGAGATHEGGASLVGPSTKTVRCSSPVYEKPCFVAPQRKASRDEGYVAMTSDATTNSCNIPPNSSGYEEMKRLTPEKCEAKAKVKKISVIYVNEM